MSEQRYTIYVCPDCGEHLTVCEYDNDRQEYNYAHYHDPPEGQSAQEFIGVPLEVVPASALEVGITEIEEAIWRGATDDALIPDHWPQWLIGAALAVTELLEHPGPSSHQPADARDNPNNHSVRDRREV